jgi:hypothetical protein
MFIIGIAEPENPGPEVDSQRRHGAYEEAIGLKLASSAKRCVEAVGVFGINGLRDRILVRSLTLYTCTYANRISTDL